MVLPFEKPSRPLHGLRKSRGDAMEDTARARVRTMLGELLTHVEGTQER